MSGRRIRRRQGRGTLAIIAGFLITSGLVRIGGEVGQAFAVGATPEAEVADVAPAQCEAGPGPGPLLEALQQREARLERRESQIADRMQALRLAEAEIEEKLAALAEAEQSLAATLRLADSAAEDDIARLTAVYENMRAEDVAALFEEMSPEFSSGFLARMRPEAAAAIMTNLTPTTAYSISVVIAARNTGVPTE